MRMKEPQAAERSLPKRQLVTLRRTDTLSGVAIPRSGIATESKGPYSLAGGPGVMLRAKVSASMMPLNP